MSVKEKLRKEPFDPSQGRKSRIVSLHQVSRMVGQRVGKPDKREYNLKDILKLAWVNSNDIYVNYERQRWPEPTHILDLRSKWNPMVITPLTCRYDPIEKRYYACDGAHHGIEMILQYGEGIDIPVCYVESTDPTVESWLLMALNNDNEPMAKYFIHKQNILLGNERAVNIENAVNNSGCTTGYKKRIAGVITHMTDLYLAEEHFGVESVEQVLTKIRTYWPTEKIPTATMIGFLKVKELMEDADSYDDETFEDVFYECSQFFESADRLHLDIKDEFVQAYPTNYRGMGVREKVASGIINVYEKRTQQSLVSMPFNIDMPMIEESSDVEYTV